MTDFVAASLTHEHMIRVNYLFGNIGDLLDVASGLARCRTSHNTHHRNG